MSIKKLERDKFMEEEELKRLLRAVLSRVRTSHGAGGRPGDHHPHVPRDYALLATSALTGIREIELVSFRIADLRGVTNSERPGRVRVRRAKKRDPKTGEPVDEEVVLPETARRALADYLATLPAAEREPWCRVFPITTKQAQRLFKLYCRRAGLNENYSMHSLRHTRGTILYAKHRDLKLVQGALGHSKLETTAIYMHTVELDAKLAATDLEGMNAEEEIHAQAQGQAVECGHRMGLVANEEEIHAQAQGQAVAATRGHAQGGPESSRGVGGEDATGRGASQSRGDEERLHPPASGAGREGAPPGRGDEDDSQPPLAQTAGASQPSHSR